MNKKANSNYQHSHQSKLVDLGECLITHHLLEENAKVGFMYREIPEDEFDSGWRFLSGSEDEEYMNDFANYKMVTIEFLLSKDDAVRNFLNRPIGTELERIEGTNRFEVYSNL